MAAIDPVQEAKLVGLRRAMVAGRYLTTADHTRSVGFTATSSTPVPASSPRAAFVSHTVPVVVASRPLTSGSLTLHIQRLHVPDPGQIPHHLTGPHNLAWMRRQRATTLKTVRLTDQNQYQRMLSAYRNPNFGINPAYRSVGQVSYRQRSDVLVPRTRVRPSTSVWLSQTAEIGGYLAPQAAQDKAFRTVQSHIESVHATSEGGHEVFDAPSLHTVGTFDPRRLRGFSPLSQVPLTTFYPPAARPANARSRTLLHGKPLLPDHDIAGYLQQPPMLLTTIRSLHSFTDATAFPGVSPAFQQAPISVIQVRVTGVTGPTPASLARVRLAAAAIARDTGLDVDIAMGSSPERELIRLPAGTNGRPPLLLGEGWVEKGVDVALLSAISTLSLALFSLVLVVCLLFLINATLAAVRTRAQELGVLSCLGWPARRIFALLEAELATTGLLAGVLGTGAAVLVASLARLDLSWTQVELITPVSTVLAALAGIWPIWRACWAAPMDAVRPRARAPRRGSRRVRSVLGLAVTGLTRLPGRTLLGAASLVVGTAALTVLIAVQRAFQGTVTGTRLGDVVAVQVRGVDYLAAAMTLGLGAFAVADVAYLNITERRAEIANPAGDRLVRGQRPKAVRHGRPPHRMLRRRPRRSRRPHRHLGRPTPPRRRRAPGGRHRRSQRRLRIPLRTHDPPGAHRLNRPGCRSPGLTTVTGPGPRCSGSGRIGVRDSRRRMKEES
jgi:hypothetical protein